MTTFTQPNDDLVHARNAFKTSLSNFATDHSDVVADMQKVVEILLTQKQFAEALKEIEQLKTLAASNKKIKIAMLEMKSRIKQIGAKSGFRSRATKKYATKKSSS